MEIWAGGPNEDQDGEAEAVKEQLLEPGNPQEQVPKVRNPDKEVQTSILSFSKKINLSPDFKNFPILSKIAGIAISGIAAPYCI